MKTLFQNADSNSNEQTRVSSICILQQPMPIDNPSVSPHPMIYPTCQNDSIRNQTPSYADKIFASFFCCRVSISHNFHPEMVISCSEIPSPLTQLCIHDCGCSSLCSVCISMSTFKSRTKDLPVCSHSRDGILTRGSFKVELDN